MLLNAFVDVATTKPEYEVADIFREYFDDYLKKYHCTEQEFKAVNDILRCRTAALGGHIWVCDHCGKWRIAWNSCKNRNCPKCGAVEKAKWLAGLSRILLPTHYHQVVFTTDHLINDLAYLNPQVIYDLLFKTASTQLKAYGQRYLGGDIGVTAALHTWGQTLQPHIHLHCMVTGGALVKTAEGYEWRATSPTWLFPVEELSADFRDAFCDGLLKLHEAGELRLVGSCAELDIAQLVAEMRAKDWEVYIQKPPTMKRQSGDDELGELPTPDELADPMKLAEYLGRYVHQTAIANSRIEEIADGKVTFWYYDNRETDASGRGSRKLMTLGAIDFIHRFLRHVLPHRYIRIRHYGLHASGMRPKLGIARFLFGLPIDVPPKPLLDLSSWLASVADETVSRCPFCEQGTLRKWRKFGALDRWRICLLMVLGLTLYPQAEPQEACP